jgi:hypothetical protein
MVMSYGVVDTNQVSLEGEELGTKDFRYTQKYSVNHLFWDILKEYKDTVEKALITTPNLNKRSFA